MCLAVPGKLLSIDDNIDPIFRKGIVSFGGINKEVNLSMVPEVKIGDYILIHVGVALSIIDEEEAEETMKYLRKMGELPELANDSD